ncbi:MAG: porin family protein [Flavobacteriaceae bacterium]
MGDKVGIQGDLLYSQQGAEFDGGKIDLNYVNVPVVLKYFLTDQIHVHAGPQFGFVVDDNIANVFANIADAESFDLSGIVGVGVDLPMGIRLDGRYNFGLSDVISSDNKDVVESGGKNSVVTLSVGYSFL